MIPSFYEMVNRNAIVVKPKKPFFDWHNGIYRDSPIHQMDDHTLYLAKLDDDSYDIEQWMKKNFDRFFKNELNDWVTDPSLWPQKRTFEMFKKWFSYEYYCVLLDTERGKIGKS
ncbi:MAG: hypothetical protein IT279_02910 [Ignavibacteriaceae bacterium]|nr:hypothetical protein [Ignavibacteriaceae bacterium]